MTISNFHRVQRPIALCLLATVALLTFNFPAVAAAKAADDINARIIDVQYEDDRVVITYDLIGAPKDVYEVKIVFLKKSDPAFRVVPETISGNIGRGEFAGSGRSIIWEFRKDKPEGFSIADDYYFQMTVRRVGGEGGGFPWLWVGLGAVAVGGGAAAVILSGNRGTTGGTTATGDLPAPPNLRP
jgi:hypothetical protein